MAFPNTFHSGLWKLTFSNIPTVSDNKEMRFFDNYVKSIILPDYNIIESYSDLKGERIRHPMSRVNEELSPIQIEFKLSEAGTNYYRLLEWMLGLRYKGQNLSNEVLRKNYIERINIMMLDNQKRHVATVYYTNAFLLNLSSISLDSGSDEEIIFTGNFSYEEMKFNTIDIGN